jgi:DNA polymerase-3 subunit delta'
VPIVPLFGHEALRARLEDAVRAHEVPASLLLHGPAGVGKQRLALHLAQCILCTAATPPCGACQGCRFTLELTHPDLHWYFPRERLKDADPSAAEVEEYYAEGRRERAEARGLYTPPPGNHGIYVSTIRALVRRASLSPALGPRKIFIVGDAERMASQEGAEQAANAFLKLLEEPPADTVLILTSSEAGALLPTIRSRVVCVRVAPLGEAAVRDFLEHESVRARLAGTLGRRGAEDELVAMAGGCPGRLLESVEEGEGALAARRLLEAAEGRSRARLLRAGFGLGATRARGGFASTLEHLTVLLHRRVREAAERGDERRAVALARAMVAVEEAKERARGNVNPQLAGTWLLRQLAGAFR